jgi:hypothetical protein
MIDQTTIEELLHRYNSLIGKYVELAKELAPKLEQFGKYREELQYISIEFKKRGFDPQIPESLSIMLEEELKSREIK